MVKWTEADVKAKLPAFGFHRSRQTDREVWTKRRKPPGRNWSRGMRRGYNIWTVEFGLASERHPIFATSPGMGWTLTYRQALAWLEQEFG